jgi:hypothetical protein
MNNSTEIHTQLEQKEDYAVSLELEILDTKDQIFNEEDETHIIFLTDHLEALQYRLDQTNADIYPLRQKLKILENEQKFQHS